MVYHAILISTGETPRSSTENRMYKKHSGWLHSAKFQCIESNNKYKQRVAGAARKVYAFHADVVVTLDTSQRKKSA